MALTLTANATKTFFHRAKDNSMEGAHIPNSALLVVDKVTIPHSGSIIVADVNGERLVRRMHRNGPSSAATGGRLGRALAGTCVLHPENAMYPSVIVKEDMQMNVLGVVTAIILEPF